VGLLPRIVIACELKKKQFTLLNWQGAKMTIATHIVWHKDKWMSPGMQAFLDVMKLKLEERPALATQKRAG
jgi:DNA-binding transcriptional LysR family regulator